MRQLEAPTARRQHLGQRQHAPLGIVATHRFAFMPDAHDADLDAMLRLQIAHHAVIGVIGVELRAGKDALGRRFQLGKVVLPSLQEGGDLFRWNARQVGAQTLLAARHALDQLAGRGARGGVALIKRQHGAADLGLRDRQLAQIGVGQAEAVEHRIAKHLQQIGHQPPLILDGKGRQIERERAAPAATAAGPAAVGDCSR